MRPIAQKRNAAHRPTRQRVAIVACPSVRNINSPDYRADLRMGSILRRFGRQRPGGDIRHDLVILAMHDQHRDVIFLRSFVKSVWEKATMRPFLGKLTMFRRHYLRRRSGTGQTPAVIADDHFPPDTI